MGHGSLVPPPSVSSVSLSELCVLVEQGVVVCSCSSSILARTGWAVLDVGLSFGFRGVEVAVIMRTRVMTQMENKVISWGPEQRDDGSVLLAG